MYGIKVIRLLSYMLRSFPIPFLSVMFDIPETPPPLHPFTFAKEFAGLRARVARVEIILYSAIRGNSLRRDDNMVHK